MKSLVLRMFPCWMLVMVLRTVLSVEYTFFAVVQTFALAFVWAFIHEVYDRKTSVFVLCLSFPLTWVGSFVNIGMFEAPMPIKWIMEAFGICLVIYAIKKIRRSEFEKVDNVRSKKFVLYNVYEYRRIKKITDAIWYMVLDGAKELGVDVKRDYYGTPAVYDEVREKLRDMGYGLMQHGKARSIVYGRDGIAVLRILDEKGDYEFKKNKWYKDGKRYINISEEAEKILEMLKKERGTNKVIIVKAFEGGSVQGSGCGYFVTDITRGSDKLIDSIKKITRVEYYSDKEKKKRDRIERALGVE